jgi:hypothetical protein
MLHPHKLIPISYGGMSLTPETPVHPGAANFPVAAGFFIPPRFRLQAWRVHLRAQHPQ